MIKMVELTKLSDKTAIKNTKNTSIDIDINYYLCYSYYKMVMMRKKGFTIVELISVIVVLTIIILIAIPAYSSIQNSINKKNKENEINLIKVAAEKYAEDYNITAVFVKDLIDAGYIDPNDGNSILNPAKKDENWDCSIVTITTTKDIRTATFNEKSYKSDDSNVCDYNKINDLNGALKIVMSDSKGEITKDTNYWTN